MKKVEFDQRRFCADLRGIVSWHGRGVWTKTKEAGISNGSFGRILADGVVRDIATIATLCHVFGLDLNNYLVVN